MYVKQVLGDGGGVDLFIEMSQLFSAFKNLTQRVNSSLAVRREGGMPDGADVPGAGGHCGWAIKEGFS